MYEREISVQDVLDAVADGETIAEYGDDKPYSSYLLLGEKEGRALHVVVARDPDTNRRIVATVYRPNLEEWMPGWKKRRPR